MKTSIVLITMMLSTSTFAYRRGNICNDSILGNTGCQAARTGCYGGCNAQPGTALLGCRAQCDGECDECTQSVAGSTAGQKYQTCLNAAKKCVDQQSCATEKNNFVDHCEALATEVLNAPPWESTPHVDPDGCGAGAIVPSCTTLQCTTNIFPIGSCKDQKTGADCSFLGNCKCAGGLPQCSGPRSGDEKFCICS